MPPIAASDKERVGKRRRIPGGTAGDVVAFSGIRAISNPPTPDRPLGNPGVPPRPGFLLDRGRHAFGIHAAQAVREAAFLMFARGTEEPSSNAGVGPCIVSNDHRALTAER